MPLLDSLLGSKVVLVRSGGLCPALDIRLLVVKVHSVHFYGLQSVDNRVASPTVFAMRDVVREAQHALAAWPGRMM
jgi:hypothetical protein